MFGRDKKKKPNQPALDPKAILSERFVKALEIAKSVAMAAGIGGVGVVTLAAFIALAGAGDTAGLMELAKGLGINWASGIMLSLIEAVRKFKPRELATDGALLEAAAATQSQLTDTRLAALYEKLNLTETALKALATSAERNAFATELLERHIVTPAQLQAASARAAVVIQGDVINSTVLNVVGSNNQIVVNNHILNLTDEIGLYKQRLVTQLSGLPFALDKQATRDKELTLTGVFTPLIADMRGQAGQNRSNLPDDAGDELASFAPGRDTPRQTPTLLDQLNDHARAVVLGGPGSGKSTVLRVLALGLSSDEAVFRETWHHGGLLPIYVELRKLAEPLRALDERSCTAEQVLNVLVSFVKQRMQANGPDLAQHLNAWVHKHGAVWLLDGLDEVPDEWRVKVQVAIALLMEQFRAARVIVACRVNTYDSADPLRTRNGPQPTEFVVRPFSPDQQNDFVRRYYDEVRVRRSTSEDETARLKRSLLDEMGDKQYLRDMGGMPLLMMVIAQLHTTVGRLPTGLCALLDEAINFLMAEWEEQRLREDNESKPGDPNASLRLVHDLISAERDTVLSKLTKVAHQTYQRQSLDISENDLSVAFVELLAELRRRPTGTRLPDWLNAQHFVDYLKNRSGLLNDEGGSPRLFKYPHKIFHEYMTARWMQSKHLDLFKTLTANAEAFEWWRNVFEFVAIRPDAEKTERVVNALWPSSATLNSGMDRERLLLAAQIWRNKPVNDDTLAQIPDIAMQIQRVRGDLSSLMHSANAPVLKRAEAGRLLGNLWQSDFQPEVSGLAAMQFCIVPKGSFILGSKKGQDKSVFDDEENGQPFDVRYSYAMARYPISQAQYTEFVRDGGYSYAPFWAEAQRAGRWNESQGVRRDAYMGVDENGKSMWDSEWAVQQRAYGQPFDLPNHPVVGVCWWEALAYGRWLDARAHQEGWLSPAWRIDLPHEVHWEKAARGGQMMPTAPRVLALDQVESRFSTGISEIRNPNPARRYAMKADAENDKADSNLINFRDSNVNGTSGLGCFSEGASPVGCEDMNGNVWEWCRNKNEAYGNDYPTAVQLEGESARVVRGGSWGYNVGLVRCASRFRFEPAAHYNYFGFRVCVLPSTSGI